MTEQEPQRKKGGRPRKHSPNARRPTMAFRMGAHLHERLIESAAQSERSLSEEIERRLEESYGGAFTTDYRTRTLLEHIVQIIERMEKAAGSKWWENEIAAAICGDSIRGLINIVMPERDAPKNMLLELIESDLSRREREAKEALWQSTLRLDAIDRAISILQGEPGSPDFVKSEDKLSQSD